MENQITSKLCDNVLTIFLNGRVSSSNAADIENEINAIRASKKGTKTVIDAKNLEYISSAGLRVLLRLRKEEPTLTMINVSPEVYDVLNMTGFTEILTVKRAYRQLSLEGCEIIGRGSNGAVYRYDDETIVKVYFNSDALPEIQRERELARKAFVLGINTAIPYDVVLVGDSYGTVMELLQATSLSKLIKKDPEHLDLPLKYFVDMLKQIHSTQLKPGELPDMKQVALGWAEFDKDYLPEEIGNKLYAMVQAIPQQLTMLHGDYHTNNVMVRNGEALLIDMDTLCTGHPIFELGSMFNAFEGFSELDHEVVLHFLRIPYEVSTLFWHKALAMYLGTDDENRIKEVENKAKVIGYMRLLRRTIRRKGPNADNLIAFYKSQLIKLVPTINKLTF